MPSFQPRYLDETELSTFGLPETTEIPSIMNLVELGSTLIDEYCGRVDGDGNGSLVYTTYTERLLMPAGRNIVRTMFKPLAAVTLTTQQALAASGVDSPWYNTGFSPNTVLKADGVTLSPLISASGRYGYGRRSSVFNTPDVAYGANLLQIAAFFGGPPQFTNIDVSTIDFDPRVGELWLPSGIYLSQYSEVVITYNSGYNPTDMPKPIKHACAAIVKNAMARGGGTTGLKSIQGGRVGGSFSDDLVDPTVQKLLQPFSTVIAY